MDRIDFAKSIDDGNNFGEKIQKFFDHTMAMYNLIGVRDNIDICAESNDQEISFVILTDDKNEAETIFDSIKNKEIKIYGHDYVPELKKTKNSIGITLIEKRE